MKETRLIIFLIITSIIISIFAARAHADVPTICPGHIKDIAVGHDPSGHISKIILSMDTGIIIFDIERNVSIQITGNEKGVQKC